MLAVEWVVEPVYVSELGMWRSSICIDRDTRSPVGFRQVSGCHLVFADTLSPLQLDPLSRVLQNSGIWQTSLAIFQLTQHIGVGLDGLNCFAMCMCVDGLGKMSQSYTLRDSNCLFLYACIVINLEELFGAFSPC